MSEIQRLPQMVNPNPVHPNAKTTTLINNGTTTTKLNILSPVCRNCKTQTTPLWRRDETGQVLCNACGLFLKLHGRPRPISLKTDTIKLRNRIKQPNFLKKNSANTPELKAKELRPPLSGLLLGLSLLVPTLLSKKLPRQSRKRSPPPDFAVQPQHQQQPPQHQQHQPQHQPQHQHQHHAIHHLPGLASSASAVPLPLSHPRVPLGHAPLPHHLHHLLGISSQVQLLHYPSSTPTQFAPGLQRITSPLMLSTTLLNARSVSSTGAASPKGSLSAAQAAGALENMLNVLGPSATFKGPGHENMNGVSLMGPSAKTPAKQDSRILPGIAPSLGTSTGASSNVIASPSFGPQFHLDSPKRDHLGLPKPSLPPLHQTVSRGMTPTNGPGTPGLGPTSGPLPSILNLHPVKTEEISHLSSEHAKIVQNSSGESQPSQAPQQSQQSGESSTNPNPEKPTQQQQGSGNDDGDRSNNNNNNNNNNQNSHGAPVPTSAEGVAYENTLLKTRISELELVNDLYRTRIMELEAMEQAARLRESSMRRRLDEVIALQSQNAHEEDEKKAKQEP